MKAIEATEITEQNWFRLESEINNIIDVRINSGCYDAIFNLIKLEASKGRANLQINTSLLTAYKINTAFLKSDLEYLGYVVEIDMLKTLAIFTIHWHKNIKDV
jgi:hypothetical protein